MSITYCQISLLCWASNGFAKTIMTWMEFAKNCNGKMFNKRHLNKINVFKIKPLLATEYVSVSKLNNILVIKVLKAFKSLNSIYLYVKLSISILYLKIHNAYNMQMNWIPNNCPALSMFCWNYLKHLSRY